MSAILDKLLKGQKVEWLRIAEVGELVRGNGLQKSDFTESGVPAIHYGQIYTFYGNFTTETKSFVSPELAEKLRKVNKGDVVITNTSENLEDVGKALLYLGEKQAVTGGHATIFRPGEKILGKYFVYFTQSDFFASEKRKYAKGTKVIDVSATDMAKILIPIPPLDVQAEIVRILDAFTAVTAELNMREKQYQYYRDKLLTFSDNEIIWKSLGELGQLIRGNGLQKSDFTEDGFPAIHYGQIYTFYGTFADKTKSFVSENLAKKLKKAQNGDVLLAGTSENIQDVMKPLGWLGNEIAISGDMFAYRPNTELDTKYLTYLTLNSFF